MVYSIVSAGAFSLICLPLMAMQDFNNPLHAVSTLMFKQIQKEEIQPKDLRDAHAQFKMYCAIRNSPPLDRKKPSSQNYIATGNVNEK